jgi:hypothetical protein
VRKVKKKRSKLKCPWCHNANYVTLKKGNVTRCCDSPVVRVNGAIHKTLDDAPEWKIISAFVAHKRRKNQYFEIPYGSAAYKGAVTPAHILLGYCKGDVELALEMVDVSFTDGFHSYRDKPNLWAIISKNHTMDVMAKAKRRLANQSQQVDIEARLSSAPSLMAP